MNNAAFVIDRSCCTVFNRLCHVIDVDVITEDFACAAIFCRNWCSGEANVGRVGKRIPYDAGSANNGFCLDFAVVLLLDHNLFIETVLPTMRFVSHHDDIPAF